MARQPLYVPLRKEKGTYNYQMHPDMGEVRWEGEVCFRVSDRRC